MAPASSSTDEPPTHVVVDCSLTPIEYWSLRDDERYHDFLQSAVDPPVTASVISREEDEDGLITRVAEVTPVKNPIPYSLRSMLGCRNGSRLSSLPPVGLPQWFCTVKYSPCTAG